jgi:hypothetical protein
MPASGTAAPCLEAALARTSSARFQALLLVAYVTAHSGREDVLADKQAAKLRRRDNREQREREKATRTGDSPAQKAEQTRRRNEASADRDLKNRGGGGDAD